MFLKNKFWGILTALSLAVASVVGISAPAQATSVAVNSGATTNSFTTPTSGFISTSINSAQVSYQNPLGGMYEVTATNSTSTTVTIQAFNNGAMDTRFNTTGSVSFTAVFTPNQRDRLLFTTYANGTKWAVLENPWSHGNYNYLHLGTVAGGYQSTITLPTTNTTDLTCTNYIASARSGTSNLVSNIELVPDTGFSAPLLSLKCSPYLNSLGASYYSYMGWLVNYSGGTTLGTPATFTTFGSGPVGPLGELNTTTKKFAINYGVSVNPNAIGSQIALTYFSALSDTSLSGGAADPGLSNTLSDYVVTRVAADGTISRQTAAWTGQTANGRSGMIVVVPRNSGTVYALQHATDGTNVVARVLTFGATGAATAQTAVTGASFASGFSRVAAINAQGTILKFASIDLGGYNPSYFDQVDASTGVATQYSSFVLTGGGSSESFLWQMTDNANGADFYSRTSTTSVLRIAATTAPTAPAVPSAPTVVVGSTQATVSWIAPANGGSAITAYTVEYSSNSGTSWTTWANNIATTSTTVTGLTNGTAYIFKVSATNAVGTSTASSSSSSSTPNPVPGVPSALTVVGNGSNAVTLSWTASSPLNTLTDYVIQYSTDNGSNWTTYADSVSTSTTANLTGLTAGQSYNFRVSGSNSIGVGSYSTASIAITSATVPANITSAPTVSASPGTITVTWTPPANGGSALTSAELQYSINAGSTWQNYSGAVDLSGTITMTGLTTGASYLVKARALNFFGASAWSSASSAITALAPTVPGTVTNVNAAAGGSAGSVALSWTAPNANGSAITDYTVEYSSDGGVTWTTWVHTASTSTSAAITGLTPGLNYTFKVTAVNGVGSSTPTSPSTPVAAAQPAPPPAEPIKVPSNIQVNKKVDVADGKVSFVGNNMQDVKTVLMNNIETTILDRTSQNITVSIPKQVLGWVDVEFITSNGKVSFESLIYVENVKANQLAKLRLGFVNPKSLTTLSAKRLTAISSKFKTAKTATCVGYYGGKISKARAIANARAACDLIAARSRTISARVAVSKEMIHAHVLVLFDY